MSGSPSLSYSPTVNVDVGGTTYWTVHNVAGPIEWSCPDEGTIVRLEPQDSNTCKITGLAGGQTEITMREHGGDHWAGKRSIGVGLIFAYAPDGSLWATSAAGFMPVDSTQASQLSIPTLDQMENQEAYYVPPPEVGTADANVTCYVINLGYIREADVWSPGTSQTTAKKSGK